MQLKLSVHSFLEMVAKTWHFMVLIIGFVWMVSAWKSAQDEHLVRIDEQIRMTQEQLSVERDQIDMENQKLDWLIRHVQSPNLPDPFPQSLKPKMHSQLFPMVSTGEPPQEAKIPYVR